MRDGAVVVGPLDVDSEGWAVRGVEDAALEQGVRLHVGVACLLNWSARHFEGVRDAEAEGTEALAVALNGDFSGGRTLCPLKGTFFAQ